MNQSFRSRECYKSILYISVVILFFQGISNTQLVIVGQFTNQNGQSWVGPLSTALLFFGSGLGCLYNKYIDKIPYRFTFFIGSLGYTLFISISVVFLKIGFNTAIQIFILVASFISGVTVSIYYNSQFNYVNVCSEIDKQETKYFGINMCIVQSCNIFGNFISALLIQPVGQFNYAVIMDVSIFIISLLFLGVKNYKYEKRSTQEIQQNNNNIPIKSLQDAEKQLTNQLNDSNSNEFSATKLPLRLIFSFAFSGVILSFIYCELSIVFYDTFQHYYQKQELNKITFIAFIIEGIGQFLGGISVVFGQFTITKTIGLQNTFVIACGTYLFALIIVYISSYIENLVLMDIATFIVGYCNCMVFTLALTISGKWRQKGITIFSIAQSFTVAIGSIMIAFIKFDFMILYSIVIFLLSTFGVLTYKKLIKA